MKSVRTSMIVALAALLAGTFAIAQDGGGKPDAPKGDAPRGGRGPNGGRGTMLDHLLPPPVLEDLKLTTEQKAKYTELETAFKKEADKWKSAHPDSMEQMRKAHEDDDREAIRKLADERKPLMDSRKASVDKLRESLTAEQKETLDKALEQGRNRGGRGPGGPGGSNGSGQGGPKGDHPPKPPAD